MKPVGLPNPLGKNACFLNSALQALASCDSCVDWVLDANESLRAAQSIVPGFQRGRALTAAPALLKDIQPHLLQAVVCFIMSLVKLLTGKAFSSRQ